MTDDEVQDMLEAVGEGWGIRLFSRNLERHFWIVPNGPARRHATEPTFQLAEWIRLQALDLVMLEWVLAAKTQFPGSAVVGEHLKSSHFRPPHQTSEVPASRADEGPRHSRSINPHFSQPRARPGAKKDLW